MTTVTDRPVGHEGAQVDVTEKTPWIGGSGLAGIAALAVIIGLPGAIALAAFGIYLLDKGSNTGALPLSYAASCSSSPSPSSPE